MVRRRELIAICLWRCVHNSNVELNLSTCLRRIFFELAVVELLDYLLARKVYVGGKEMTLTVVEMKHLHKTVNNGLGCIYLMKKTTNPVAPVHDGTKFLNLCFCGPESCEIREVA